MNIYICIKNNNSDQTGRKKYTDQKQQHIFHPFPSELSDYIFANIFSQETAACFLTYNTTEPQVPSILGLGETQSTNKYREE